MHMERLVPDLNEPEYLLRSIAGFGEARLAEQISDGPVNASFRFLLDGQPYVFRRDKRALKTLGLDRDREAGIIRSLSAAGLAMPFCYEDRERGLTIRRWLPGNVLTEDELRQPGFLRKIAGLLRQVHGTECSEEPMDFEAAMRRYLEAAPQSRSVFDEAQAMYHEIRGFGPYDSLCHNDPVAGNFVVYGAEISLIDWEYAAPGDPFFDLAAVCEHHHLEREGRELLFKAYLQREPDSAERERFSLQCRFYTRLLELWRAATPV